MEILNRIDSEKYNQLIEFLAFLSIYDDDKRMKVFKEIIKRCDMKGKVVAELGAGFGEFTKFIIELGAKRVYAVEINPYMLTILRKKLKNINNVRIVEGDALNFVPEEDINIVIHDFFGPLLYDESLYVLDNLKFKPKIVIPNEGLLKCGTIKLSEINDPTVDRDVIETLEGVLIADLFDYYQKPEKSYTVAKWKYGEGLKMYEVELKDEGEVLVFWLEIYHDGEFLCSSYECINWPLVWTYRRGDRFKIFFEWNGEFSDVIFTWI